jgi:hypothetical protein
METPGIMAELQMTCHCGALSQTLAGVQRRSADIPLCHCYGCRHSTGQLFASYVELQLSSLEALGTCDNLTEYTAVAGSATRPTVKLYFCSTCGCHAFRSTTIGSDTTIEVASGTLIAGDESTIQESSAPFGPQLNVNDTVDGGLAKWMTNIQGQAQDSSTRHYSESDVVKMTGSVSEGSGLHMAACLCKRVMFQLYNPTEASLAPHSHFADLIIPFHTQDPVIKNPDNVKWWMRQDNSRFMAGTCACRSCRLVSGFEIQSWAFVPRVNIMFGTGVADTSSASEWEVLDFDKVHQRGFIKGYESSRGVVREFCPGCGATVFWHDTSRPELIDVSAGLLVPLPPSGGQDGHEGARIESLLDWWTSRVSFAEEAITGRKGAPERRARWLVETLEAGMRSNSAQ